MVRNAILVALVGRALGVARSHVQESNMKLRGKGWEELARNIYAKGAKNVPELPPWEKLPPFYRSMFIRDIRVELGKIITDNHERNNQD